MGQSGQLLQYFDQQMHALACIHMVEINENRLKIVKKVLFSSYTRETHVFASKVDFFNNFQAFLIVFNHVNACVSMHLLVKLHNRHIVQNINIEKFGLSKICHSFFSVLVEING